MSATDRTSPLSCPLDYPTETDHRFYSPQPSHKHIHTPVLDSRRPKEEKFGGERQQTIKDLPAVLADRRDMGTPRRYRQDSLLR